MSVVYSHFWRLLKSEEEDKEEEDKEEEDKEEETLENKMKWILKNLMTVWKKFEKNETLLRKKQKKKRANFNKTNAKHSVETLCRSHHHHPPRLNYKTAKTRKLKLKLYLKL